MIWSKYMKQFLSLLILRFFLTVGLKYDLYLKVCLKPSKPQSIDAHGMSLTGQNFINIHNKAQNFRASY